MSIYEYKTNGTCARKITVELTDDIVVHCVQFEGGCSGNTQGVAALVKGMPVEEVIARLDGIDCGGRGTSCPAQLALALKETL